MTFRRSYAVGDPQSTFAKFQAILQRHGLLSAHGSLADDVFLLSIGDHFDFAGEPARVGAEGLALLRWLAAHPPGQVVILAGNHDVSRVMELASVTGERFELARKAALRLKETRGESPETFHRDFPEIPVPGLAGRDYSSFSHEQRDLVQSLLLNGRLRLAHAARTVDGRDLLLTHAGVTRRELAGLDLPANVEPRAAAERLNRFLDRAVDRVRPAWESGKRAALDLAPIHAAGATGIEGGGLLYHRPSNPDRPGAPPRVEFEEPARRRFDPRELPAGLLQACGHSGHKKCLKELGAWAMPSATRTARGGLRTLTVQGSRVTYEGGILPVSREAAGLYFIDGEMDLVPAEDYPLFELGG
jgi:hypothetical protein